MNLFRVMVDRWLEPVARFFTGTTVGRAIVFVSLPLVLLVIAFWETKHEPPIFDAMVLYNEEAWGRVPVKAIIGTARELNVPWMVVGSTPNEGTWRLAAADRTRIIPMFVPHRSRDERTIWYNEPEVLQLMETEIGRGVYRGIGEFWLSDGQINTPNVKRMVELAAKHNLVLHARSDPAALEQLFALNPKVRIMWAHAGIFAKPDKIGEMLDRFPLLWAELSHRADVAPHGKLNAEWRALLMRHPNRFLIGSGTYTSQYWYQFRYAHGNHRDWLKELPPEVAERIAYRNGLELFALK